MEKPTRYYMRALVLDTSTNVMFEFSLYAPDIPTARTAIADLMRPYVGSTVSGFDRVLKAWVGHQPYIHGSYHFQPGVTAEMCNPSPSVDWEPLHGTAG